ncbi:MAG TPA: DUF1304 domain-containing protein [Thermoanaerobaculia bacterium]|nr:DUF1304 domain-containing protein [Thermoanaerobaculia bacterium]
MTPIAIAASVTTALVALLHIWFMILESFLWSTPRGMRIFGLTPESAAATKSLAANQGLYNGFLAAGLIWSLCLTSPAGVRIFFLTCVIVAGIVGSITAKRSILYVQALPAVIALALSLAARY